MVLVTLVPAPALSTTGIEVEVSGGGEEVTDWIVEQPLDLETAARLLGIPAAADATKTAIVELDAGGNVLGVKSTQVDAGEREGEVVVSWLVDGRLPPRQARRFKIELGGREKIPRPVKTVEATVVQTQCVIRNAPWTVTHDANRGGLITRLEVENAEGGVVLPLTLAEKVYDGEVYALGGHRALETRVLSSGPLRAVYELKQAYQGGKGRPPTRPLAIYRWTSFAGMPVTRVDATVTQDYAKKWDCLMFLEINIGEAVAAGTITHGITDQWEVARELAAENDDYGREWSAVFGPKALIGVLKTDDNFVYRKDFIRGGYIVWGSTELRRRSYLFWGRGGGDVAELARWNRILTNPPRATVRLEPLEQTLRALDEELAGREGAIGQTAASLAAMKLDFARREAKAGRFGSAEKACADARDLFDPSATAWEIRKAGTITAGILGENAFLENDRVSIVFGNLGKGAGVVSIRDRATGREFLETDLSDVPFWQVAFKQEEGGGATLTNHGVPCKVSVATDDGRGEGALVFEWAGLAHDDTEDIGNVRVTVSLREGESLGRARIEATADHPEYGLSQVVFPDIAGIAPLTPAAAEDYVLHTGDVGGMGDVAASPLNSGVNVSVTYPNFGMQFSAVYGGGNGLYLAEEDPDAASKQMEWLADGARGTLSFRISHPVLGHAGSEPVRRYRSPGDIVLGPFQGDWYDACRLYRKWATTSAPWCRNGPIATNEEYPKWLADLSYWEESAVNFEVNAERPFATHAFYGVPGHALHLYGWYFSLHMDDRYPEYFPPHVGPENFQALVGRYQAAGMRVVPYVNGYCWDTDTESYRTKDVATRGALLDSYGKEHVFTNYGGGQKLVAMCPATALWRETLLDVSRELVSRYRVDGIYFDFLNPHNKDCFAPQHGHPIGGGNFWSKSVQDLYRMIRAELKAVNPDCMLTGEKIGEPYIGLLDTFYCTQGVRTKAPIFTAVYHDHALVFAARRGDGDPINMGRSFILGKQNGPFFDVRTPEQKEYSRTLLQCLDKFARPYLAYGDMLRMPLITGELPTITGKAGGGYNVPAVEGTAWRAPDGRVGLIFVNYDEEPHEFDWELDLEDSGGWDGQTRLQISQWTVADGRRPLGDVPGGVLRRKETLEGWGVLGVELEAAVGGR